MKIELKTSMCIPSVKDLLMAKESRKLMPRRIHTCKGSWEATSVIMGATMIDGGCILDPGTMGAAPVNMRRMRSTEFSSMIEVKLSVGTLNVGLYELDH